MGTPRVTVVMPAYNAAQFIDEAINSIRGQTLTDWEMIVVDDGSTDATKDIAEGHAAEDRRIRVIYQANAGQAAANNRAIPEARGEYIARMDADDVSLPERLLRQTAFLDENPTMAAVGSGVDLIDDSGRRGGRMSFHFTPDEVRCALLVHKQACLLNPTVMFRRKVWLEVGGERPCFMSAHDNDLWLRIAEQHPVAILSECYVWYRVHQANISLTAVESQGLCLLAAIRVSELRREKKVDLVGDRVAPIDADFLCSLGCTSDECENAILDCIGGQIALSFAAGCSERAIGLMQQLRQRRLSSATPAAWAFHHFVAHMRLAVWQAKRGQLPLATLELCANWRGAIEAGRRVLQKLRVV
jgi:glycosyltransferase involved in cell wall biosynthesis